MKKKKEKNEKKTNDSNRVRHEYKSKTTRHAIAYYRSVLHLFFLIDHYDKHERYFLAQRKTLRISSKIRWKHHHHRVLRNFSIEHYVHVVRPRVFVLIRLLKNRLQ